MLTLELLPLPKPTTILPAESASISLCSAHVTVEVPVTPPVAIADPHREPHSHADEYHMLHVGAITKHFNRPNPTLEGFALRGRTRMSSPPLICGQLWMLTPVSTLECCSTCAFAKDKGHRKLRQLLPLQRDPVRGQRPMADEEDSGFGSPVADHCRPQQELVITKVTTPNLHG